MRLAAEIQIDLDDVIVSIKRVLTGGQEYSLDTGQSKQFNKRASLKELRLYKQDLQSELSLAQNREDGTSVTQGTFR